MNFRCFYCHYELDESVEGPDYLELTSHAASKVARLVLANDGDFFGLLDAENLIIQFIVGDDGYITIDMPINTDGKVILFQKKTGLGEVEKIISNLPASFAGLENVLNLSDVT
jgi:hypothetical protein